MHPGDREYPNVQLLMNYDEARSKLLQRVHASVGLDPHGSHRFRSMGYFLTRWPADDHCQRVVRVRK